MLHADVTEADEAFSGPQGEPYEIIDEALTQAYDEIIQEAEGEVDPDFFKFEMQVQWPQGQAVFTLPNHIDRANVLYMRDITSGAPGIVLKPGHAPEYGTPAGVYWSSPNQISWTNQGNWASALSATGAPIIVLTGPATLMTLSIAYSANSIIFSEPTQEPLGIPFKYRRMWPLRAACMLDPAHVLQPAWMEQYERAKQAFHFKLNQIGKAGNYNPETDVDALW
jgi:hypothetical protein